MDRRTARIDRILLAACAAAVLGGCAKTTFVGLGPFEPGKEVPPGLRYHVAKDVLVVTDTVSYELSVTVDPASLRPQSRLEMRSTRPHVALNATADTDAVYVINLNPKGTVKDSLGVTVTGDGLLTSVTYSATDRTAETVASVAKGLSAALGMAVGFREGAREDRVTDKWEAAFDSVWKDVTVKEGLEMERRQRFLVTPPEVVYYLAESQVGREPWRRLVQLDEELQGMWRVYTDQLLAAGSATTSDKVDYHVKRAAAVHTAITAVELRRQAAQGAFDVGLRKFLAERGIETKTFKRVVVLSLDLDSLPKAKDVEGGAMDVNSVESRLGTAVAELFKETRIVVALDAVGPRPAQAKGANETRTPFAVIDSARVHYRPPRHMLLTTYGVEPAPRDSGEVAQVLRKKTQELVSVLYPTDPVAFLEYSAESFAKSNFGLTFDERGRLTGLTQGSSGGSAEASATLAAAVGEAQNAYAESLKKSKEIQETQQAIRMMELDNRIDELTKRKALIDARLGLQGATASAALVAEKARVDAELALLQSQQQLGEAGGVVDQAAETAELRAEIERLRLQVKMLQKLNAGSP